ncbi:MAG: DUF3108 domain-containing protein [Chitinophagales bacterium]|jgi:hypothetical protein|nr:DUF3108 domain-containing protein [Chitinophagales bacterium]
MSAYRLILFLCFSSYISSAKTQITLPSSESLTYFVYYKYSEAYVKAGKVDFKLQKTIDSSKKSVYSAKIYGKTATYFDVFYKVRDEYGSVFSLDYKPHYFIRRVNEGGFWIKNDLYFDMDSLKVKCDIEDKKNPRQILEFPIDSMTKDMVTAIYYCRSLPFDQMKIGDSINFPVFIDNQNFMLGFTYRGQQTILIEGIDYPCFIIEPDLVKGRIFDSNHAMKIYITSDHRRIPVYIEAKIKVGYILAILNQIDR